MCHVSNLTGEVKTYRCLGCGDIFEYIRRKPKWCRECRKEKLYVSIKRYKRRIRKLTNKGDREEHFGGNSNFLASVGGASHEEIASRLDIKKKQVEELERRALLKIRDNPELKNLWDTLKQELAEGAVIDGQSLAVNKGELLLEYQLSVADWWQTHDDIVEQGCSNEALELLDEIAQFQRKISEALADSRP